MSKSENESFPTWTFILSNLDICHVVKFLKLDGKEKNRKGKIGNNGIGKTAKQKCAKINKKTVHKLKDS